MGRALWGDSSIMIDNGIDIYDEPVMADLAVMKRYFRINNRDDIRNKNVFFEYGNGSLFLKNGNSKVDFIIAISRKENSILKTIWISQSIILLRQDMLQVEEKK